MSKEIAGPEISHAVVLVTGSSRGIGAETVKILAQRGAHVIVNYREKAKRAQAIVNQIIKDGGKASLVGADVTDPESVQELVNKLSEEFGKLDALVLNASGGLEIGKDDSYPMKINRDAQVHLLKALLPLIPIGGRVVFVTSHQAHFYGQKPVPNGYEPIAESKQAGEKAIRELIPELSDKGVSVAVVSGDMIDGTIIVTLLARRDPNAVAERHEKGGALPTVEEFATAIADAVTDKIPTGHTYFIGGKDYQDLAQNLAAESAKSS